MTTSAGFIAIVARVAGFASAFSLLPPRLIRWEAKAALAVSLLLFCLPLGLPAKGGGAVELVLAFDKLTMAAVDSALLTRELVVGAVLGLVFSVAIFAAEILGAWLTALIGPKSGAFRSRPHARSATHVFIVLLAVTVCFDHWAMLKLWKVVGDAFLVFGLPAAPLSTQGALAAVFKAGRAALFVAAVIALPVFVLSLLIDLLYVLYQRYFKQAFERSLVGTTRVPLLILCLSLLLYPFTEQLSRLFESSMGSEVLRTISQK